MTTVVWANRFQTDHSISKVGFVQFESGGMSHRGQIDGEVFQGDIRLKRVRLYVLENYSETISLEIVANVAGMEKKYFSAFFKKKVGIQFRYWLRSIRIDEAIRIMENHRNRSITDVAFEVGFNDLRSFQRAFKMCTGLSALDFMNSPNRNNTECDLSLRHVVSKITISDATGN